MADPPPNVGASASSDGLAALLVGLLRERAATVAVAESLTGGLVGAALTEVPGASAVFRGGITAYATDLKATLLDVDPHLLAERGAVHPQVAAAMAGGVRTRLGATYGVATTGVAGPDPQEGNQPGTLHVAVVGPAAELGASFRLEGDRAQVRRHSVICALRLATEALRNGHPAAAP